jgi:protein-S-isoprenylcysteine O-methyltransferase Ste14
MSALRIGILIAWLVFWIGWVAAAVGAKQSARTGRVRIPGLAIAGAFVIVHFINPHPGTVHEPALEVLGVVLFVAGLGLAVWARVNLGRNWGMPMTQKAEPELVTSGPYRLIRHPIYSGILLAMAGSALASDLLWLIVLAVCAAYFIYSATVEERNMTAIFPTTYPTYKAGTKMLIPFVL